MQLETLAVDHHRNGISGHPFDLVLFRDIGHKSNLMLGILFEEPHYCAVLDVEKLAAGDIEFGSNSWRGDNYEPFLRRAIEQARGGRP
jgi:hypothetical protein